MTQTITLPRKAALDLLEDTHVVGADPINGFEAIEVTNDGSGKWMSRHRLIIRRVDDGKLFASPFDKGLTERQSHDFWGSDSWDDGEGNESAEFVEVAVRQKVVTEYVKPGEMPEGDAVKVVPADAIVLHQDLPHPPALVDADGKHWFIDLRSGGYHRTYPVCFKEFGPLTLLPADDADRNTA